MEHTPEYQHMIAVERDLHEMVILLSSIVTLLTKIERNQPNPLDFG